MFEALKTPGPSPLGFDASRCSLAERRQAEAGRIRDKYPDRIPVSSGTAAGLFDTPMLFTCNAEETVVWQVIVEKAEKSDIPDIDKKKYGLWQLLQAQKHLFKAGTRLTG